jgi:DNA-binding transcriptional ArsR family regulator
MLNHPPAVARLFLTLADPNRRRMVEQLSHGPASISELARPLGVSLAAVVQHVQHLEDSGLVRTEKVGRIRTCYLRLEGLQPAERWLADRRALWERRLDRLGVLLDGAGSPESTRKQEETDA